MEGFYRLAKMVVNKKFPNGDDELKAFFICAIYGLLCKFNNYPEIVCDLFLNTDIYMENDITSNILKKHDIEIEFEDEDDEYSRTHAVSNQGHLFVYDEEWDSINYAKANPSIICSLVDTTPVLLLNYFCHEMAHLVKGHIDGYNIFNNKNITDYYMRTGLAHYIYQYDSKKDTLTENQVFSYFDEAINTIQTTEIMKYILDIVNYTDDSSIHELINTFDKEDMLEDHGYEEIIDEVRMLWDIDEVKRIIEENIVEGRIEDSIYRINKMLDNQYGFGRICDIIDNIALNYGKKNKKHYLNYQRNKLKKFVKKIKNNQKEK